MDDLRKFYFISYYQSPRDLQLRRVEAGRGTHRWQIDKRPMESQVHKVRDGLASGLLVSVLINNGYEYGGPVLNIPDAVAEELNRLEKIKIVDDPSGRSDLLLLTTRPPLNDFDDGENNVKRPILCSGSKIEEAAFDKLRVFFRGCSRSRVILHPEIHLPPEAEHFRDLSFKQSGGALVKQPSHPDLKNRTVAYMLSTPPIRHLGPRLVAAFGIGGTETLILAYLIRMQPEFNAVFRRLLEDTEPRLAIVSFMVPTFIPQPYLSYDAGDLDGRLEANESVKRAYEGSQHPRGNDHLD